MKIVAVSQRVDLIPERKEVRDALDQRLSALILETGFIPVPIPNSLFTVLADDHLDCRFLDDWLGALKPSAVVLSGGNDIGQCPSRDLTERHLLEVAKCMNLPVLGICRGMQMLGHFAGVGLHSVKKHVGTNHPIFGEIERTVNSYHTVSLSACPQDYGVLARSADGEIEAIGHHVLPWEGWMWHPEREAEFRVKDIIRTKKLFNSK